MFHSFCHFAVYLTSLCIYICSGYNFMKRPHSWGLRNRKKLHFNVGVGAGVEHSLETLEKH